MSLLPILWAMKSAPVVDVEERVILMTMGESAWADGTDAFPSKKTLAEISMLDPKTVQRRLRSMTERKLIAPGNQAAAAYIPEWSRPNVYDLLIPYSYFPDVDQVNTERKARGKDPLTPESRPDIAPAPPKKARADKGKGRRKGGDSKGGGDYKSPGCTTTHSGQEGGTPSPGGGDCKSQRGGLQDLQPSPTNPPQDPPRPSIPPESAYEEEGGTDGNRAADEAGQAPTAQPAAPNPGVSLLLAIGAEKPELLLTGKTLKDQGLTVAGMLLEGWTEQQLWQVIAGRPLPKPVKTTVGGVIAGRLRDAMAAPPPSSIPSQARSDFQQAGGPTPTPASYQEKLARAATLPDSECVGKDGMCGKPVPAGNNLCRSCSGQPAHAPF